MCVCACVLNKKYSNLLKLFLIIIRSTDFRNLFGSVTFYLFCVGNVIVFHFSSYLFFLNKVNYHSGSTFIKRIVSMNVLFPVSLNTFKFKLFCFKLRMCENVIFCSYMYFIM